jgi:hypothetical protein
MRPRVVMLACLAVLVVAGGAMLIVPATRMRLEALGTHSTAAAAGQSSALGTARTAAQAAPPLPVLRAPADPASITPNAKVTFFSWAFMDLATGKITGSANSVTGTNSTESMVKAWIASDYLRTHPSPPQSALDDLHLMIINSNDDEAQKYYEIGGGDVDIKRLISMCGLTHTTIYNYWWSRTQMSPQDAVAYGRCVANGTAAGAKWTPWILEQMREVTGGVNDQISVQVQGGRWGIIDGLPANLVPTTSIKNGWTQYGNGWHVNCLAINPNNWVLNVMVRTSGDSRLQTPANVCKSVAQQLTVTPEI